MRDVRFCTEKDGSIMKELCSQCTHLGKKKASRDLESPSSQRGRNKR